MHLSVIADARGGFCISTCCFARKKNFVCFFLLVCVRGVGGGGVMHIVSAGWICDCGCGFTGSVELVPLDMRRGPQGILDTEQGVFFYCQSVVFYFSEKLRQNAIHSIFQSII